jgi:superfamily II DNA or RNA helicase
LVLSEWKEHVGKLSQRLRDSGKEPLVLDGGLRKKDRDAIFESIRGASPDKELIVIATGQYLGEGFDCPQLDALFLAFPVSFRGKLVQYTGRLLREYEGKTSVAVYDYADRSVPVLKAMLAKRMKTYKSLRFVSEALGSATDIAAFPLRE